MRRFTPLQEALMIGTGILLASIGVAARTLLVNPTQSPSQPNAKQISLKVNLSHPILLESSDQKAYVKIDLEGFAMESKQERTPVNVAIVIDRSGSMDGERIRDAKKAAVVAINHLDKNDIVSVIAYDDEATVIFPASRVTDKQAVIQAIEKIQIGGSTALFAGVSKGAQEIRKFLDKNRVNRVILLSDGQANVGPSSPLELGNLGTSLGKEGISVTTIGIGLGFNEDLMTQLALNSDGNHSFVKDPEELVAIFNHEFKDVLSVVAQNATITIQFAEGIKPLRVLGREAEIYGNKVVAMLRQLYSKQEKELLVEVEIPASYKDTSQALASVVSTYDNMFTHQKDTLTAQTRASFTRDKTIVAQNLDKRVMAAAAEQIGVLNNEKAIKLRDEGKTGEAQKVLTENAAFLDQSAKTYDAPTLAPIAVQAQEASKKLSDQDWNENRKGLNRDGFRSKTKQSY